MKYAALIYSRPGSYEKLSEDEFKAVFAQYMALADDPRSAALAARIPAARLGGAVEVRRLVER